MLPFIVNYKLVHDAQESILPKMSDPQIYLLWAIVIFISSSHISTVESHSEGHWLFALFTTSSCFYVWCDAPPTILEAVLANLIRQRDLVQLGIQAIQAGPCAPLSSRCILGIDLIIII